MTFAPPVPSARICSWQYEQRSEGVIHLGMDFCAEEGTPILAPEAGVVEAVYETAIGGNTVAVKHGPDLWSRYAHCKTILVRPGQKVRRGQQIATVGCTGSSCRSSHLHFGFTKVHYTPGTHVYREEDVWDVLTVLAKWGIVTSGSKLVYLPGWPKQDRPFVVPLLAAALGAAAVVGAAWIVREVW